MKNWCALYPGQGSQHPGMGRFLFDEFAAARETFEEGSDALKIDFKKLCFEGSDSELALTHNTQPCLLLVSTATHRVLKKEFDFAPKALAGHSVGEYAALVNTNVISLSDGLKAVRRRGEAMQKAVPVGTGGMAAVIGLTSLQVIELCRWVEKTAALEGLKTPLEPANFNCPGQIVISGRVELIDWVIKNFSKEKAELVFSSEALKTPVTKVRFIPLNVSAPFHCSMMKPAEDEMRSVLSDMAFQNSAQPIVQNYSAQPTTQAMQLRENIIKQVSAPVRWIESIENLSGLGSTHFIEVGCGKVVSGLTKKILGEKAQVFTTQSLEDIKGLENEFRK